MIRRPPRSTLFPYRRSSDLTLKRYFFMRESNRLTIQRHPQNSIGRGGDRKSTRLNSSHSQISYSFFFFNDTATTEIYPLSLQTLFRSNAKKVFFHARE